MACAHFHAGIVSRSHGRSAVEAAAYTMREDYRDLRTGESHSNARNAADAVHAFVWLPKGAPEQYRDAETLANYMESRETRKNSRTARTFEGSLPHELTEEQRLRLVKDFARELTRKGLAVIVAVHRPHEHGDERNHHFHMVVSTRTMDANGFGAKDRDSNTREALLHWRQRFEVLTNSQLERAGHSARIDMRSFKDQGIDATPQIHMGPAIAAMERQGIPTTRGDHYREVRAERDREQGQTWTAGKPRMVAVVAEAVPVVSAVERQAEEDRRDRATAQREAAAAEARAAAVPLHLRLMAAAMRFLRIASGGMLDRTMGRVDDATIAASMRQAKRDQIQHAEKAVPDHPAQELQPAPSQAPPPFSRKHAREDLRQFVDRGNRPAPFRALVGELRDGEHEQRPQANDTAGGRVWSHEKQPEATVQAAPAGPAPRPAQRVGFIERLEAEQRAKGQTLNDLIPKREREKEKGLGLDLEL